MDFTLTNILPSWFSWDWLWLQRGLIVAYIVLIVMMIVSVLSENRNPLKSIAWITALLLFPVGGAILYYFFGRSLRHVRIISRRNRRKLRRLESGAAAILPRNISRDNRRSMRLAYSVAGALVYADNDIELFTSGREHFDALFADLRRARNFISIQFYIIANDALGRELRDILIEKAREGVKIRVIYDYIGSFDARRRDFFMRMKDAGIEVHSFFRLQFPGKLNRLNWRNHRKVVVIDGNVGYIGGMNVAQRYVDGGHFSCWRDTAVRVVGSGVGGLQYYFAIDWQFMGHALLTDVPHSGLPTPIPRKSIKGVTVQLVPSGPTDRWGSSSFLFLQVIGSARKRVFIQTPYFLPSDGLLKALQCAALAGVDVRIMMPRRSDSALLTDASFSYVEECLLAGIKIYLFEPGMLHAKVLIVDGDFATTGSTNFDFRSFEHNFEENIVMYSGEVNERMAAQFMADSTRCSRIKLSEWSHRPRGSKIRQSLCRLFSPIL